MLSLLLTVLAMPDPATTRVHLVVESPTRTYELVRQQRPDDPYRTDMLAAESVCRERCNLDVDVDPRLDYVLNVTGTRFPVNMTEHGSSLLLRVEPPSRAKRIASSVMIPVGLVSSILGSIAGVTGGILAVASGAPNDLGVALAAGGATAFGVGVITFIIGIVLRRTSVIELSSEPGTVQPSSAPLTPEVPAAPPPPPPPSPTET
ncbi:MAG: hypothetical protein JNK82_12015 [Myxococcaceae bacterium]|nr:hypothetical protein [Myxococcaceae bacterium]